MYLSLSKWVKKQLMRRIVILYFALFLILNSCTRCSDCCEYMSGSQAIVGQSYGTIFLNASRENWIPKFTNNDSILLVNSMGGQESYLYHQTTKKEIYRLNLEQTRIMANCRDNEQIISHHGMAEKENLDYYSYLPIIQKLRIERGFYVNYNMDSSAFMQASEFFKVTWNNLFLSPDLNNYSNQPSKKFHLSITLNGHVYDSIFECYQVNADPNYIGPEGFYYSKKEGFVGFYLSRHLQEWLKK